MSEVKNIQCWFKNNIRDHGAPYTLDKNQAKIVSDHHKNTLAIARAGSGKTRTIVAKIVYLLTHEHIKPEEIIVFAFNKKACIEINERVAKIEYKNKTLFNGPPSIATTFHAFAYQLLGGSKVLKNRLETATEPETRFGNCNSDQNAEEERQKIRKSHQTTQFITRAEQQFFKDYDILLEKIKNLKNEEIRQQLLKEFTNLEKYHQKLKSENKLNFNQLIANAATKLKTIRETPYKYIFIDEYQDFSLLFLTLIKSLRETCKSAHLLSVGDDWQAINRFAGSDVEYFTHFEKYFSEDCIKLRIPTNYRSGKKIVKNANFFMAKALDDYAGCKAKNKAKSKIFYAKCENYYLAVKNIILQNIILKNTKQSKTKPKSIKILSRNNNIRFKNQSLENFVEKVKAEILKDNPDTTIDLTSSTIHKSKGLEADIVILLEIDPEKFPGPDKSGGLYEIFGDNAKTLLQDEVRLFYVALTRAKEKLYILSKNPTITKGNKKYNFFSYLNPDFLDPLL